MAASYTCSGLASESAASAPEHLSRDEILIVCVYVCTIALLLLGPKRLFAKFKWSSLFIFERTSYSPLMGLVLLAVLPSGNTHAHGYVPIVTSRLVAKVLTQHYGIVLLILGLASMSVSVDISGFFENLARRMLTTGAKGDALVMRIFWLSAILTYFTSNDSVIVSITPLILELAKQSNTDPTKMLLAQFIAANTASMGLYIGNPTNIILSDTIGLSFFEYLVLMTPATVAAMFATWICVRLLLASSSLRCCCDDILRSEVYQSHVNKAGSTKVEFEHLRAPQIVRIKVFVLATDLCVMCVWGLVTRLPLFVVSLAGAFVCASVDIYMCIASTKTHQHGHDIRTSTHSSMPPSPSWRLLQDYVNRISARMPWCIAPFVFGMFIIVEAATSAGLVSRFAWTFYQTVHGQHPIAIALVSALISSVFVNLVNNLPATVLWTLVLPQLCTRYILSRREYVCVLLSLLVGNNVGACLTTVGALAGLMWMSIINPDPNSGSKPLSQPIEETRLSDDNLSSIELGPTTGSSNNTSLNPNPKPTPRSPYRRIDPLAHLPLALSKVGSIVLICVCAISAVVIGVQVSLMFR